MRRPDESKRVQDALMLRRLARRLDEASETADYERLLRELEPALPMAEATPDLPIFSVLPTTFEHREEWRDLLSGYALDDDVLSRLLNGGFVPLDRESADFGVIGDPFPPGIADRYVLLDSDYATVLLPPEGGRLRNRSLELQSLLRYRPHFPILDSEASALYSIGAIRGHLGYHGSLGGNYFEPVDVTVSTRAELEHVVARVRENLAGKPHLALWFRGQAREYLMDDLSAEAERGICPWRSLQDPSLVPSLCRRLTGSQGSWQEYASVLLEFGEYGTFLEEELDIPAFDVRAPDDAPRERLGAEWGELGLTAYGGDTGEMHDYQRAIDDYNLIKVST